MKFACLPFLASAALLAACSSSESSPPNSPTNVTDSGATSSGADSGTHVTAGSDSGTGTTSDDAGTGTTDSDAGDDGGTTTAASCAGLGTAVAADWSFASSAATLNSGKGQVLSVNRCDTVTWTNSDNGTPHSVVSTSGPVMFSTNQANGVMALTPIQFTTAGTYAYECGVHGNMMIGTITVAP